MKRAAKPLAVIDVPPANPDEQMVKSEGSQIQSFVRNLAQFFATATELEVSAKGTLAKAHALTLPKTGVEDEAVQTFVRQTRADLKEVEAHWVITSMIHGFHKRLVAARTRAVWPLDEAAQIGNRLHAAYVEAEQRRVREEQERLRRQAEQQAAADRARELAALEAQAVAAEESSPDLSEREGDFVARMADPASRSYDQAQLSAQFAGFKDPLKAAARLMSLPKIQQALKARREALALREQAIAVQAAPVPVGEVPTVKADIVGSAGRTTWGYEVTDEGAFIEAVLAGKHGIPRDTLTINAAKMGEYARSLRERLDLWPGLRHTKKTSVL